ncbi:hypothetical protein RCL_jg5741.t2 [Rhizophagus clarus]|uniref:Uncharacterized protein n=1 Tax=Rhizophagus clarus TaxID=94130 RepID=A0A8H3M7B7_9GLOM|nr:hypothetical protein RCL_jg5741.t2 [Rhizophagus clarus]
MELLKKESEQHVVYLDGIGTNFQVGEAVSLGQPRFELKNSHVEDYLFIIKFRREYVQLKSGISFSAWSRFLEFDVLNIKL